MNNKNMWHQLVKSLLVVVLFSLITACGGGGSSKSSVNPPVNPPTPPPPPPPVLLSYDNFTLTFEDEFDDLILDKTKWHPNLPWNWGTISLNDERQGYVEDNVELSSGSLKLNLEKRDVTGLKNGVQTTFDYASGAISGKSIFFQKYGLFEIKAKLPGGGGSWPAFWVMPENGNIWEPYGSEVDIFEHFTINGNALQFGLFFDGYGEHSQHWTAPLVTVPTYSTEFHTYSYEWSPNELNFYVDGELEASYSGIAVPTTESYIILNAALGGIGGNIDDSALPDFMEIDYVRIYQYEDYDAIQLQEDERIGSEGVNRYTFEDAATLDELLTNYSHSINTSIVSLATHRATFANGSVDKPTEVLTGNVSLKGDSRGESSDFNEIFVTPTHQFLANSDYKVTINYRQVSLFSDAKIYAQIKADSDDAILTTYDFVDQKTGRARFSFNTGARADYSLIVGLFKKGSVIIDDIIIEGPGPGDNFAFIKGSGGGAGNGQSTGSQYAGVEDFESVTINDIYDAANSNFAFELVTLTAEPSEIVSGLVSLKGDSNITTSTDWREIYHSPLGRIEAQKSYTISFKAKGLNLEPGSAFYYLVRSANRASTGASDAFGYTEWYNGSGSETITFTTDIGDYTDYYLIVGVYDKGALIIDDVTITVN